MQYLDDLDLYPLSLKGNTTYKDLQLWLNRWLDELTINKVSHRTIKAYKEAIYNFLKFVRYNKIDIDKISARYINRYLINYQIELATKKNLTKILELKQEAKLPKIGRNDANFTILEEFESTLNHRVIVLKMFLKYITENNSDLHDYTKLFSNIANIKIQEKLTDYLTPKELEQVIEHLLNWDIEFKKYYPKASKYESSRNALLMLILATTGARGDETIHIKLQDIKDFYKDDKHYYIINIEEGKGGKKRRVIVHSKYLKKYIDYMRDTLPNDSFYISSTRRNKIYTNKPVHINSFRAYSNNMLKLIGINKQGLHIYRRGYATKRIGIDKVDISIVAKELGNTTAILEHHYLKYAPEFGI